MDRESYLSTSIVSIPAMPSAKNSGGPDSAARAVRAFERGATTLGVQVARSLYGRWRRASAGRPPSIEGPAADRRVAETIVAPARTEPEVSDVDVQDLRAELTRELERLANADISAARGPGAVAGETASADDQA